MAVKKITLKRVADSSGTLDNLYPTTTLDQIISEGTGPVVDGSATDESLSDYLSDTYVAQSTLGQASGVATLDSNSQLTLSQLPVAVVGGLSFVSTFSLSGGKTVDDVMTALNANPANIDIGDYLTISTGGELSQGSTWTGGIRPPGDEGDYSLPVTLEAGDWIVVSQVSTSPNLVTFGIINNTYKNASASVKGIVQLSNASTVTGMSGNDVITEGVLAGLVGTGSGDLAAGNHLHTGVYKPNFSEASAFNKAFGTGSGEVAEGNHLHDGRYLQLSGGTLTSDITMQYDGDTSANRGSHAIRFQGYSTIGSASFDKYMSMNSNGQLEFGTALSRKRVYTLDSTNKGRVFWDSPSNADLQEGDFIFDDDATT